MLGQRIMTDQIRGTGQRNSHQQSRRGIAGLNRSGPRKAGRGRRLRRGKGGRGRGRGRGRAWPERSVVSVKEVRAAGRRTPRALILQLISREILPRQDSRTRHTPSRVSLTILFVTILLASLPSPPPSKITRMHASLTTSVTHLHLRLRLKVPKRSTTEIRLFEPVHTHKPIFSTRCVGPSLRMYRERVDGTAAPRSVYSERRAWRAKYIVQVTLNTANLFFEQLVEKSGLEFTRSLRGGCYIHRILTSTENDLEWILLSKMTYPKVALECLRMVDPG